MVRADELRPHPKNWRLHPPEQQEAMRGVLAEIGYADALIARECDDGSLQLIDGHLRAETTPDAEVPVLVVDLDESEADTLLALHDPLAAMATTDDEMLADLAASIETDNRAIREMLDRMTDDPPPIDDSPGFEPPIAEMFQLVIDCKDEDHQREVFDRLTGEGLACRVLNL